MSENAKEYKKISLEIIDILHKEEYNMLEELLNKRQYILDNEKDSRKFRYDLIDSDILDIDNKIYELLNKNVTKTKKEIMEHKLSKQVNNSYIKYNKDKLNIFSEKV